MKKLYFNEKWCLGCRLCEYNCAFANSGSKSMVKALKGKVIHPNIHVEGDNFSSYPLNCRQCKDPVCVKSCISGALHLEDGIIKIDKTKCVNCMTCMMVCPYGAIVLGDNGTISKCELCTNNQNKVPACAAGCPNKAIVFEER